MTPRQELETVLDQERAQAVLEHRQRLRKPLTAYAARLLVKRFSEAPDPNAAADMMIEHGWQGFKMSWPTVQQEFAATRSASVSPSYHSKPATVEPQISEGERQRVAARMARLSADLARTKAWENPEYARAEREKRLKWQRIRDNMRHSRNVGG